MASRYHSSTTTTYSANDRKLDELLEDLQSTVATRPSINGTTGYRETYKSISSQQNGQPAQISKEYEVEYLSPSNSTTLVRDRSKSPHFDQDQANKSGTYKIVSYEHTSNTKSRKTDSQSATPVIDRKYEKQSEKTQSKFRNNINELDTLLGDLDISHHAEYNTSSSDQIHRYNTYDSGFIEPLDHSTPHKSSHISKIQQKSFEEKRFGNSSPIRHTEIKKEVYLNGQPVERVVDRYVSGDNEPKRDLIFTGGSLRHREPSPVRQHRQEVYNYETKTSTRKTAEVPQRQINNYNYESDVTDNIDRHISLYDRNRSPSPVRSLHNYSSNTVKETTTQHRSPSPARSYYSSSSNVTRTVTPQPTRATYSRNEIIQETTRREISHRSPTTPPPHRSPSPVSFSQPPDPSTEYSSRSYNYEQGIRPQSPIYKFSPSDQTPEHSPGHTVITRNYKYSSQSTQNSRYPAEPCNHESTSNNRSFPSLSPQPEIREQKPPKQLDELMASFNDSESHYRESYNKYNNVNTSKNDSKSPVPIKSPHTVETQKLNETTKQNGVTGPPVYYPPGPLFTKKEECALMSESAAGKGKMMAKRKAMYEYEAGSKMKESSKMKKTVVPICLPACCALPCVIM